MNRCIQFFSAIGEQRHGWECKLFEAVNKCVIAEDEYRSNSHMRALLSGDGSWSRSHYQRSVSACPTQRLRPFQPRQLSFLGWTEVQQPQITRVRLCDAFDNHRPTRQTCEDVILCHSISYAASSCPTPSLDHAAIALSALSCATVATVLAACTPSCRLQTRSMPSAASAPPSTPGLFAVSSLILIALLFTLSFITDALSKDILRHHPYSLTLTLSQFAMSALASGVYLVATRRLHVLAVAQLPPLLLLITAAHSLGFLTTNLSLANLPVSFTHTIKASESLFTALLTRLVMPSLRYSAALYLTLVPIVAGVAISSWAEASFEWLGFAAALSSNACFAGRSVMSSRLMKEEKSKMAETSGRSGSSGAETSLDDVNLYFYISLLATLSLLPFWYVTELPHLPPLVQPFRSSLSSLPALLTTTSFTSSLWLLLTSSYLLSLAANGLLHYSYNQCSFVLLSRLSPLTHVVINACRRLFVIYVSVVWYGVPLTLSNVLGTVLVVGGVVAFATEKGRIDAQQQQQIKAKAA